MSSKRIVQVDLDIKGEDQIKNVDKAIKDTSVDAAHLAENTLKLSKGLAGSFELASQAASVFGSSTGKAFEETIARATQYIALSNSLKDVAEGFTKENIKGLTGVFQGFTKAGLGAKLFGNTTKSAITATGIGALVVLLGLVIANFDAIKESVLKFANSIPFVKKLVDYFTELFDTIGSIGNLLDGIGGFITNLFTKGASAIDGFNKALQSSKNVDALKEQAEQLAIQNESRERSIKLLEAQGKKELDILALQKQIATELLQNLEARKAAGEDLSAEDLKRLEDLKTEIQLIEIRTGKAVDAQKKEADALAEKKQKESDARKKESADKAKAIKDDFDKYMADVDARIQERLKAEREALKNIRQLQINAIADEQVRNSAQVKFDYDQKIKALIGNQKQVTEQTVLLEKERQDKLANIELDGYKKRQAAAAANAKQIAADQAAQDELDLQARQQQIQQIQAYVDAAGQFIGQISQFMSDQISQNIAGIQSQLDFINQEYTQSLLDRNSLQEELATADGARRDEILNSIASQKSKEEALAAQQKKLKNEQIKQQNKQNELNYANAVIQSTILTANAILAALATAPPASFVLAAITAGLAAVQTVIVASNPPKTIPSFDKGGYTTGLGFKDSSGYEVAGIIHQDEYVIPKSVLSTSTGSQLAQIAESMRTGKKSFADGGYSTPQVSPSSNGLLNGDMLRNALQGLNLSVGVTEINQVRNRVSAIEQRASV